jgi:hypothetical protein
MGTEVDDFETGAHVCIFGLYGSAIRLIQQRSMPEKVSLVKPTGLIRGADPQGEIRRDHE